jgi:4a-hydroxytetrahydrobiopterin dehydratase
MSNDLANKHCKPCEGGVEPLQAAEAKQLLTELHKDWCISADGLEISRTFTFPAYSRSLGFANAVAWIAITEGHHPDMLLSYSKCTVNWTTHAIGGLSDNDFICAAKVDLLIE